MQGGRGGRNSFFEGFGDPFGGHRSLMSSFFGGRDPFDDPFFASPFSTSPFGGMFESSFFGSNGSPFAPMRHSPFMEHRQALEPPKRSRGPIIQELGSDDEQDEADKEKTENPRKHVRPRKEPYVEDPDDAPEERRIKHCQYRSSQNGFNVMQAQPRTQSFTFQSSTVTYGGANGPYYSSSKARRTGSDGVTIEESKEADTSTRKATHTLSRGLHNKGHTFTRKLNSDGKVDAMQTLHNLDEGELADFEKAWKGNVRQALPGWNGNFSGHDSMGVGGSGRIASQGRWALPSSDQMQHSGRPIPDALDRAASSQMHRTGRVRGASNARDMNAFTKGKARE